MVIDNTCSRLLKAIAAAGIPIDSVSDSGVGASPRFLVTLDPSATSSQAARAQAIATSFDTRPRSMRGYQQILSDVRGLAAADRNTLINAMLSAWIQQDPAFATSLGIAIQGDQVDAS